MSQKLNLPPLLTTIQASLPAGQPVYLVGGAVRDLVLSRPVHDYDFALSRNALAVSRKLADRMGAAFFPLDIERQTARIIYVDEKGHRYILDFATLRGNNLEQDLQDRDFTINAIALDLEAPQELLDPLGGAADLYARRLRACSPHAIANDPVRVLRAVRLAAGFNLQIHPDTRQQVRAAVSGLAQISPERRRDETLKILAGPRPHTAILALDLLGAIPYILPELPALKGVAQSPPHVKDVWNHTLDTVKALDEILNSLSPVHNPEETGSLMHGLLVMRLGRYRQQINQYLAHELVPERTSRSLLFLATLYHDIAKPQTRTVEDSGRIRYFNHDVVGSDVITYRAVEARLSNQESEHLAKIVRHHMRPSFLSHQENGPSKRAVYRFFRDTGEAGVGVCLLSLADVWATYGPTLTQERWAHQLNTVRTLLEAWWENAETNVHPQALISGHDLIQTLALKPGPQIGEILEAVRESQVEGDTTTPQEALELARNLATGHEKTSA